MTKGILLFFLCASLGAQNRVVDNNFNAWATYDGNHPLQDTHWRLHLEGQWRRADAGLTWQQLLLRPGITYAFTPKISATLGYAFVETWPYGFMPTGTRFPENRIWEQLALSYQTGKVSWVSRFRFENRWIGVPGEGWRYENRLRLMQRTLVPISSRTFFTASNELFVFVKPYVSNSDFDQNRAIVALGWKLADHWRIEAGYMNQALLRRSGLVLESNNTIRITLVTDAVFRRK